jgi:hypothetical protein
MAPYFVISLCDILCELPEPHGARGAMTFFVNCLNHMVQEGPLCAGNLSTASGDRLSGNRSKT